MVDILEIFSSYITKLNPSEDRKKLAAQRYEICSECDNMVGTKAFSRCAKCGCFIGGKIYSPREDPCPDNKWQEVDIKYFDSRTSKIRKQGKKLV